MDPRPRPFEFRRTSDGLVYRFEPAGAYAGRPRWKRADLDLWCEFTQFGWAIVDSEGNRFGWPLEQANDSELPPESRWRSSKGEKSYLYDLCYVDTALP